MKNMRHLADIFRPSEVMDDRGQEHGDTRIYQGVLCSIKQLNSAEQEAARQAYAAATSRVEMYGDPKIPLTNRDYLKVNGAILHIGAIDDKNRNGEYLVLTCGEEVP